MQRSNYCVYKHTCLAPGNSFGKVYIGITCRRKPEYRWNHGKNYGHCLYLDNAIKKYGWENFSHEILATGLSRSEAKKMERKYVREYRANDPKYGFNLTPGGDRLVGGESPVARPVVAFDAMSGIRLFDFESVSDAERELGGSPSSVLSGSAKTTQGVILRYYDDVGATMVLPETDCFRPRSQPSKYKPVNQYSLDGEYLATFMSVKEAEHTLNLSRDVVGNAARGAAKSGGGFQWKYDTGDHSNISKYVPNHEARNANNGYNGKLIEQIDAETGEILHVYKSIREAARAVNGNRRNIYSIANGDDRKKRASGYNWRIVQE